MSAPATRTSISRETFAARLLGTDTSRPPAWEVRLTHEHPVVESLVELRSDGSGETLLRVVSEDLRVPFSTLCSTFGAEDRLVVIHHGVPLVVAVEEGVHAWQPRYRSYIQAVVELAELDLLLLVDHDEIIALSGDEVLWVTPRLCLDDLRIQRVTGKVLHAVADETMGAPRHVRVDLRSGDALGVEKAFAHGARRELSEMKMPVAVRRLSTPAPE